MSLDKLTFRQPQASSPIEPTMSKNKTKASAKKSKKTATIAAAPRAKLPRQNGIAHPKAEGVTGKLWALADSITAREGRTATRAEVLASAAKAKLAPGMASTQYGYWRRFHGIKGRLAKPGAAPAAPKGKGGKKGAKPAAKGKGGKGKAAIPAAPVPAIPAAPAAIPAAPAA